MKDFRVAGDRWLKMFQRTWTRHGKSSVWTFVSRQDEPGETCENKKPEAVLIAAVHDEPGKSPRHLLTVEYRVPLGGYEVGFPAGLIDDGETAEQAAVREVYEETGLTLEVGAVSPANLYSSAGLSDESVTIVFGTVRGTPSNKFLEPSEDIRSLLLTKEEMVEAVKEDKPFDSVGWSCKVWPIVTAWCSGFDALYAPK